MALALWACAAQSDSEPEPRSNVVDGGQAGSFQRQFVLTVLGSVEQLKTVQAAGLQSEPASEGTGARRFVAGLADWEARWQVTFADSASFELKPWLCPRTDGAEQAIEAGATVTESRTVELDEHGDQFWSNGRYGQAFPTSCSVTTSARSAWGTTAIQNGPCLCDEPERERTHVEVTRESDGAVMLPTACVAFSGAMGSHGTVGLLFNGAQDVTGERTITLAMTHCLEPEQVPPFEVTTAVLQSKNCPWEGAKLSVGAVKATGKPESWSAVEGSWRIQSASSARDGRHLSEFSLGFVDSHGERYRATGKVDLPQVLE